MLHSIVISANQKLSGSIIPPNNNDAFLPANIGKHALNVFPKRRILRALRGNNNGHPSSATLRYFFEHGPEP